MKLKIRQKILLYILSVFAILYLVAIGYILISSRAALYKDANEKAQLIAKNVAGEVTTFFERDLSLTRTLSKAFTVYRTMPPEQWQKLFMAMYEPVLEANPHVYSIWDSWEYYGFVPGYTKDHGRAVITLHKEDNKVVRQFEERSAAGDPPLYGKFKSEAKENLWEPYVDQVLTGKKEAKLMTTAATPVIIDGKFMGLIGLDIVLEELQKVVERIKPVEGSFAILISNTGIIAGHPNGELINKNLNDVYPLDVIRENIIQRIQKAEDFSYVRVDEEGKQHHMYFSPIKPGNAFSPWSVALSIPYSEMMRVANRTLYVSLIVGLIGLILVIILIIYVSDNLTRPIRQITSSLKRLANGEISSKLVLDVKTGDEIEEMAEALNISITGLNRKTAFALDIGKGELATNMELLSEEDILGKSLIDMRNSLKKAQSEDEKRRVEDAKRAWANEGISMFSDILRKNSENLQNLFDEIVSQIVKYLKANQAGLFILNDDDRNDPYFQLVSAFAWERKKFMKKRLEVGDGLVGACAMEKETILLTEIPTDYVTITSGLGKANPNCIILVPLKHDNEVLGVIELASFNVFEQHEVEFLERLGDSIASAVSSVRINAKTRALLEQSQQQAEEMLAQEEEMRQNMEELQATQEEMSRKAEEQKHREDDLRISYEQEISRLRQILQDKGINF
jgi:methyl-accepting chemotaxis protein